MEIRRATGNETAAITQLWLGLMEEHGYLDPRLALKPQSDRFFEEQLRAVIDDPDWLPLVAVDADDAVLGYCLARAGKRMPIYLEPEYGEIIDLVVRPEHRGKGIATSLVKQVRVWFDGRGLKRLQVTVAQRNERAVRFWKKQGLADFLAVLSTDIEPPDL